MKCLWKNELWSSSVIFGRVFRVPIRSEAPILAYTRRWVILSRHVAIRGKMDHKQYLSVSITAMRYFYSKQCFMDEKEDFYYTETFALFIKHLQEGDPVMDRSSSKAVFKHARKVCHRVTSSTLYVEECELYKEWRNHAQSWALMWKMTLALMGSLTFNKSRRLYEKALSVVALHKWKLPLFIPSMVLEK